MTNLAANPSMNPASVVSHSSALPSQFAAADGHAPVWGKILFGITLIALAYSIWQSHVSIKHMTEENDQGKKTIDELKYNVQNIMGSKYKTVV